MTQRNSKAHEDMRYKETHRHSEYDRRRKTKNKVEKKGDLLYSVER